MENIVVEKLHSGAVNEILKIKLFKIYITIWAKKNYLYKKNRNFWCAALSYAKDGISLYFLVQKIWNFEKCKVRLNLEDFPRFPWELSHFNNFRKLISSEQKKIEICRLLHMKEQHIKNYDFFYINNFFLPI